MTEARDTRTAQIIRGGALEIEHVSALYPRAPYPALQDVSMKVAPGEVMVLLGPNGSGKSTLLRLAAGIVAPTNGRVRIDGHDVRDFDRRRLARLVAYVPQSEAIAFGFSVREVVAMGRAPHQGQWMRERPEDREAIEGALAMCDLTRLFARRVDELSGGEQRRVALARALAQQARILLLDEPGAFFDVRHRLDLNDLLAEVVKRDRLTCVVAIHELDAAAQIASRILLLREGRVVAGGPADEVMTPARLREAFDAEIDVGVHAGSGRRQFFVVGK